MNSDKTSENRRINTLTGEKKRGERIEVTKNGNRYCKTNRSCGEKKPIRVMLKIRGTGGEADLNR